MWQHMFLHIFNFANNKTAQNMVLHGSCLSHKWNSFNAIQMTSEELNILLFFIIIIFFIFDAW